MSVVVAYKWAADPQEAVVDPAGEVDWSRAWANISEYDPVAMEFGRQLAAATGTEYVGISVGPSALASPMAQKAALSRGVDRGLVISDDVCATWTRTQLAAALAALVQRAGGEILLTGDASIDEPARLTGPLVAGYLGWPCFEEITAVEREADGWKLTQHVPGGQRTIAVAGPVVVAITTDAVPERIPGMKDILASGKKPFEQVPAAEVTLPAARITVVGRERPQPRERKQAMFRGEQAVAELVSALRADGVLQEMK